MAQCEDITGETFYYRCMNEAPFIPGDDYGISPEKLDPPNSDLYDKELIKQGHGFVRRNFFGIALAGVAAGMSGALSERVRVVLLRQGHVHIKETAFKRFLANFKRVLTWYQSDFTSQDSRATTDLKAVRNSHKIAAQRHSNLRHPQLPPLSPQDRSYLQKIQQVTSGIHDTDFPRDLMQEDPQLPISQFDLVLAQCSFIVPFLLYPKSFGVHDTEGLEGFIRLWSLIGKQLGIQDRFNVALHYEKTGGQTDAISLIEQRIIMPCLKQTDDTALIMWKAMLEGFSANVPVIRLKPLIRHMLKRYGLPAHLLDEHMDWRDQVSSRILDFVLGQLTKWAAGRLVLNSAVHFYLWIAYRIYLKE